ncbi:MAG: rhodanese-like domain-containing protein [Candidatus Nanosalina sp.]
MRTLSTTELEEMDEDDFLLINVLGQEDFREEHIPGSVNIPVDEIEDNLEGLPKDKKIVVYCRSTSCEASEDAARKLQKNGFDNVVDYAPGIKAWKNSGNSVVGEGE